MGYKKNSTLRLLILVISISTTNNLVLSQIIVQGNLPNPSGNPVTSFPAGIVPGTQQYFLGASGSLSYYNYDAQSFTVPTSALYTIQTQFNNTAGAVGNPLALTCPWSYQFTILYSAAPNLTAGHYFDNIVLNPNSPANSPSFPSPGTSPYVNIGYDAFPGSYNQLDNVQLNTGTTYYLVVGNTNNSSSITGVYQHLITETPEPGSLIALGLGLTALARRKRKNKAI